MQKVHYDKDLSGVTACKRVSYDYAHEDISKVTCKACLRSNKACSRLSEGGRKLPTKKSNRKGSAPAKSG
jgi:hypothetical protein